MEIENPLLSRVHINLFYKVRACCMREAYNTGHIIGSALSVTTNL